MSSDGLRVVRTTAFFLLLSSLLAGAAQADRIELVSRALPELVSETAGTGSTLLTASADARWVVFASSATNLVSGQIDTNQADDVFLYDRDTEAVVLVSHVSASAVTTGNGVSGGTAGISSDGRFIVFLSQARNLISGVTDANSGLEDVFLFDRETGALTLVSRSAASPAQTANSSSAEPVISADGNFVAFHSSSTNLVSGVTDTNSNSDVFLFDRSTGTNSLVSRSATSATTTANNLSQSASISANGSWVAYLSRATNVVTGQTDTNNAVDGFLWERATNTARLVSRASTATTAAGNNAVSAVRVGPGGGFVLFKSRGSNHVTSQSDTNGSDDLFLFDRTTAGVTLVTRRGTSSTSTPSGGLAPDFAFSADGAWVAFATSASNVLNFQTERNTGVDVFLFSRAAGSVSLVSRRVGTTTTTTAMEGSPSTGSLAMSSDGRWIAYVCPGTELVAGQVDTNLGADVFLFDRVAGTNTLVSGLEGSATTTAGNAARKLLLSADGGRIAYATAAWNTIAGVVDTNGADDLLVWDSAGNTTVLASRRDPALPSTSTGGDSTLATLPGSAVSADGRFVVFLSTADRLVPGQIDTNGLRDVFLYDRATGETTLVSRVAGTAATAAPRTNDTGAGFATISAGGRWIAFSTDTSPLVPGMIGSAQEDVFLYDRVTGDLRLLSRSATFLPTLRGAGGTRPAISADGSYVALLSRGSLVAGMSDPQSNSNDVFLYDRNADSYTLVSHRAGTPLTAAGGASDPRISADGRFVSFASSASLVTPFAEGFSNVYLWDRTTGANVLVSTSPGSSTSASAHALSADGNWVAWAGNSSTVVPGGTDTNNGNDVFLYERATGINVLVSHTALSPVTTGNSSSGTPLISADGSWVAFTSAATNLVAGDSGFATDLFFFERATGAVRKIPGSAGAVFPSLSAGGSRATFQSSENNLVPGQVDTNGERDVFLVDRDLLETRLVSRAASSPLEAGNAFSSGPVLSANGEVLAFQSSATNLTADDRNVRSDVFVHIVEAAADLAISLSAAPDPVGRGQTLTYLVTVTNAGPGAATNITATVGLPAGTSFSGAAGDGWTCGPAGGAVTCARSSLPAGSASAVTIQATAPVARGILTLTATALVAAATPDPVANNGASVSTAVIQPGITVSPLTGLTTTEAGGTATFAVTLASAPLADVTIPLASSDTAEGTVSPASLTFTTADWSVPQTVTVTGVDDDYDDGTVEHTITTGAAESTDAAWAGLDPADVDVSNEDDDTAGIVAAPTGGLYTTEGGGTATFTVVLLARPTRNVTIDLESSDAGEGLPEPASLTFTTDDWTTPQTVTVTGQDDDLRDGDIHYTIVLQPALSGDPAFDGIDPADVAAVNRDDAYEGVYYTIPQCILVDTQVPGYGPALQNNQVAVVDVHGACSIPPTARAVVMNLTYSGAGQRGVMAIFPGDLAAPPVGEYLWIEAGNFARSLFSIMPLGADGTLAILPKLKAPKLNPTVHIVLDVSGYFE